MAMAYADFDFYTNSFKGSTIKDSATFDNFMLKACIYVDLVTFNRITEVSENVQLCSCELAELMYNQSVKLSGQAIQSEKNGSYSVTYSVPDSGTYTTDYKRTLKNICLRWLGSTGLMYRGVSDDC